MAVFAAQNAAESKEGISSWNSLSGMHLHCRHSVARPYAGCADLFVHSDSIRRRRTLLRTVQRQSTTATSDASTSSAPLSPLRYSARLPGYRTFRRQSIPRDPIDAKPSF